MRWVVLFLLFSTSAFAQGAQPGDGVLLHNRQFLFGWYEDGPERSTVWNLMKAVTRDAYVQRHVFRPKSARLTYELRQPLGIDDMIVARAGRVQAVVTSPMMRPIGPHGSAMWRDWIETTFFGYEPGDAFVDSKGKRWRIQKMLFDEAFLTGFAAHRWYCQPRNKPLIEIQMDVRFEDDEEVKEYCERTNAFASSVYDTIKSRQLRE